MKEALSGEFKRFGVRRKGMRNQEEKAQRARLHGVDIQMPALTGGDQGPGDRRSVKPDLANTATALFRTAINISAAPHEKAARVVKEAEHVLPRASYLPS